MKNTRKIVASTVIATSLVAGTVNMAQASSAFSEKSATVQASSVQSSVSKCVINRFNKTGLFGKNGSYEAFVFFPRLTPTSNWVDGGSIQRIEVYQYGKRVPVNGWRPMFNKYCISYVKVWITPPNSKQITIIANRKLDLA